MTTGSSRQEEPQTDPAERAAYVALATIPGIGAQRLATLLAEFGSAGAVFERANRGHNLATLIPADIAGRVTADRIDRSIEALERHRNRDLHTLIPSDARFPAALRSIPDPPVLLWYRGNVDAFDHRAVAVVGSRTHSAYGARVAREVAAAAAHAGLAVVSGMARGLDAVGHNAVLDAGGTTIGVLGTGPDVIYPVENRPLFERVAAHGLLLTEHPPGQAAHPGAFPRRNRLISGLATVVVVAEAARGSGTMLTVASALEQGKDVFAAPGPIFSPTSAGTNQLIRDGAQPLLEVEDFLAAYGVEPKPGPELNSAPCNLSREEALAYNALNESPRSVDEIALDTGLPVAQLLGTLLGLELGGLIAQRGGAYLRTTR